jgi:hypothetical protein
MAYWRMRIRAGKGGEDLWPLCEKNGVAAITYDGIHNVNLAFYSDKKRPPGWNEIGGGGAKPSLSRFAWQIRGGDTVFVASNGKIVGMGHPHAESGKIAYKFSLRSPIITSTGEVWHHLIEMDWESTFTPFKPKQMRAPLFTLLDMNQQEVNEFLASSRVSELRQSELQENEIQTALLLEDEYTRYTPTALRHIRREHASLSNSFTNWMKDEHGLRVVQEKQQIDATFEVGNLNFLIEFKIAYQGNTKKAIREALGQILEYNYYPPRVCHDHWLLILNSTPSDEDRQYLGFLKEALHFPLSLGWRTMPGFSFDPPLKL